MVTASDDPPADRRQLSSPAEKRIHPPPPPPPPSRSRRSLHNFSFPPTLNLSWGNQRVLRCVNPKPNPNPNPKVNPIDDEPAESSSPANLNRPWNLRSRRSAAAGRGQSPPQPPPSPSPSPKSPKIVQVEEGRGNLGKSLRSRVENGGERSKFSVALLREEIEEDFVRMKGSKPPRRPKKRAKYIQRQVDSVFPGMWLQEITADLYKIDESNLAV